MATPVFEEFDPTSDCDCPGCDHWRRVLPPAVRGRAGGHPAARSRARTGGTPMALAVAAAACSVLGTSHPAPALAAAHALQWPGAPADGELDNPQGGRAPLHGPGGAPVQPPGSLGVPTTTRAEIITRAKRWVTERVPYSMTAYWYDGYRQDCSGYVSMAWKLPGNEWTGSLGQYGVRITKAQLQPGDILLFHNLANPSLGSHVVIFGGWTDATRTRYLAYEQTRPRTRAQITPYAYWNNSSGFVPYRYKGVVESQTGAGGSQQTAHAYPGAAAFGPGANNRHVSRLGRMLIGRGAGRFYASGPGPRWTAADRAATRAFQRAQGWRGPAADGLPGPGTWRLLVTGRGRDIPAAASKVPAYPGRGSFRPGARNEHVTLLGRQLVRKGFGRHYTSGPGPAWGEADRRNVEAFQRAQGWRGGAADGLPGPETWRRLFS